MDSGTLSCAAKALWRLLEQHSCLLPQQLATAVLVVTQTPGCLRTPPPTNGHPQRARYKTIQLRRPRIVRTSIRNFY